MSLRINSEAPNFDAETTLTYPMSTGRHFDEVLRLLDCASSPRRIKSQPSSTGSAATTSSSLPQSPTKMPARSTPMAGRNRCHTCDASPTPSA